MQYVIVGGGLEGESNVTLFVPGEAPLTAHSSHPNFDKIVEGVRSGDESVVDLFDLAKTAATRFERLTERVTVANQRLYFDGDEVHDALAEQVVRFLADGVEDWKPLVNFYENVQQNPQEYSRNQLYAWLTDRDFTITPDGLIVGYKGVRTTSDDDGFRSIFTGRAIVDGEVQTGNISNKIGSIIEMPRDQVAFAPDVACSYGLHVGTWRYAKDFSQGAVLEVHVNPRDVVSVPSDSHNEKMRVCRYRVVNTIDVPYEEAVVADYYIGGYAALDDDGEYWGDDDWDDDDQPY